MDLMNGGRSIIGVGLGTAEKHYPPYVTPTDSRVSRFLEGLEILKAIWTKRQVTYRGRFWQFEKFDLEPKPIQNPHPPIWFGGRHPAALKRAVKHGDGWIGAGYSSISQFKEQAGLVRRYLDDAGRDPATFPIAKRVYITIDQDRARGQERMKEWFTRIYGDPDAATRVTVVGSIRECQEQLAEIISGGAQLIALNQVFDHMEHLELFAEEIIPGLQA